jgi:hypothetical protein
MPLEFWGKSPVPEDKQQVLRELSFGQRVAEEEAAQLSAYFVETDQWRRVWDGEVDIVYGAKGAGKSAIYATLSQRDGPNKPMTFDWCLLRTRDGTKNNAPRELIHLLSAAREVQLRRLELGEPAPPDPFLFERTAVKDALPEVSEVRLTKTLYAEYDEYRRYLELLEGQKTNHSARTLSNI